MARFTGHDLKMVMKLAFITGLPNDISMKLQQALAIETLTIGDLLTQVRMLTRGTAKDMVATMQLSQNEVVLKAKPQTAITCYRCRG